MTCQAEPLNAPIKAATQRIPPHRRWKLAKEWLLRCGQAATRKRMEALLPFVGRYHPSSPFGHIANQLVSQGRLPVHAEVFQIFKLLSESKRPSEHISFTPDQEEADEAVTWLRAYALEAGHGPVWRELGVHMGWTGAQTENAIPHLRQLGLVTYTREHRSLKAL